MQVTRILTVLLFGLAAAAQTVEVQTPYVPTEAGTVNAMLELANPHPGDVIYDLGCGDGRIIIEAAKRYGIRGVGVDINPARIDEANANARQAGVTNLVSFRVGDLYETDFREATIVALYLLPDVNIRLRPRLQKELRPGARIVSHNFDMGTWVPDKEARTGGERIFLWNLR